MKSKGGKTIKNKGKEVENKCFLKKWKHEVFMKQKTD